jgi:CO/xanthine dehydrogenase Mo-binding subunit
MPVSPAVLKAIYDAAGVQTNVLPVTPERIVKVLREEQQPSR